MGSPSTWSRAGDAVVQLRSALIGGLAAVVVVVALLVVAFGGLLPASDGQGRSIDGPVAVALVLPGADGSVALRALDVYTRERSGWSVRSVSPTSRAVVSGTGGTRISDAYSFGGGSMVAEVLRTQMGIPVRAWVVIDETAWLELRSGSAVVVALPKGIEVFDGGTLSSFPEGTSTVPARQTGVLLDGAGYLAGPESKRVRETVGDSLASSLTSSGPDASSAVESSLGSNALREWIRSLRPLERVSGT